MTHPGQLVELPRDFVGQYDVPFIRGIVVLRWSPLMLALVVLAGGGRYVPAGRGPRHGDDRALEGVAPAKIRRGEKQLSFFVFTALPKNVSRPQIYYHDSRRCVRTVWAQGHARALGKQGVYKLLIPATAPCLILCGSVRDPNTALRDGRSSPPRGRLQNPPRG